MEQFVFDERERVRLVAVDLLLAHAPSVLTRWAEALLHAEPLISWSVHSRLLWSPLDLGDVRFLEEVDDGWLQASLAAYRTR